MAWHPTKKILAVGWDNGELLVWNEHDHELHESLPLHKTSITVLGWSSAGTRLSSGDKVDIWNILVSVLLKSILWLKKELRPYLYSL